MCIAMRRFCMFQYKWVSEESKLGSGPNLFLLCMKTWHAHTNDISFIYCWYVTLLTYTEIHLCMFRLNYTLIQGRSSSTKGGRATAVRDNDAHAHPLHTCLLIVLPPSSAVWLLRMSVVFRQHIYQPCPQIHLHMYIQQLCMVEPAHYAGITRPRRTKQNQTTQD